MGIPAAECATVAQSLGIKVVVNEFVSYLQLAASGGAGLAERSRVILTYALCGFTNFASVGIMVTGMVGAVPGTARGDHRAGAEEPGRGQHRLLHGRGDGRGADGALSAPMAASPQGAEVEPQGAEV